MKLCKCGVKVKPACKYLVALGGEGWMVMVIVLGCQRLQRRDVISCKKFAISWFEPVQSFTAWNRGIVS